VIAVAIFAFVEMEHVEEIAGMLSDTSVLANRKSPHSAGFLSHDSQKPRIRA